MKGLTGRVTRTLTTVPRCSRRPNSGESTWWRLGDSAADQPGRIPGEGGQRSSRTLGTRRGADRPGVVFYLINEELRLEGFRHVVNGEPMGRSPGSGLLPPDPRKNEPGIWTKDPSQIVRIVDAATRGQGVKAPGIHRTTKRARWKGQVEGIAHLESRASSSTRPPRFGRGDGPGGDVDPGGPEAATCQP